MFTADGQSASLSWNKAPIWGLRPDFYYYKTVAGLLMWSALSDGSVVYNCCWPSSAQSNSSVVRMHVYWPIAQHWAWRDHMDFSIVACAYFGRCLGMGLRVTILLHFVGGTEENHEHLNYDI
jgi:hypothetical protein